MFLLIDTYLEEVICTEKHIDDILAYLAHIHKKLIEYAPYSVVRDSINGYVVVDVSEDYVSSDLYQIEYGIQTDIHRTFSTSIKLLNDMNEDCCEELYRFGK